MRNPITVGDARLEFEDVTSIVDPGNFSTVSAGLAVDLDFPVSARFSICPYAHLSYGTVTGGSDAAWTC